MLKKIIIFAIAALFTLSTFSYGGLNLDIDLGVNTQIGDDDLYLRINAHYFDKDPEYVRKAVRRHVISEREYPVILFLSHYSGRDFDFIVSMRHRGLSWWDISLTLGIPVSVYFVDMEWRPNGPPYGKAYGYWKKHQRNPKYRFVLTDQDVYDLISLKMTCSYYKMSPDEVFKLRQKGVHYKHIVTDQYWKHRSHPSQGKSKAKKCNKENGKDKNRRYVKKK